jgi:hypothetical protein
MRTEGPQGLDLTRPSTLTDTRPPCFEVESREQITDFEKKIELS